MNTSERPQWKVPAPIDIPWQVCANGERLWQAQEGDDWRFTFIVMKHPKDGYWSTNLSDGVNHAKPEGAVREVEEHFRTCLERCLASRPLEEFIEELAPDLAIAMGQDQADAASETLKTAAAGAASFSVRELPWLLTREGNMITRGGEGFPWPFTYLAIRRDDHWQHDGDDMRASRIDAQSDAQRHFEARISRLTTGPLEHDIRSQLIEAAADSPESLFAVFQQTYGLTLEEPAPALDVTAP